MNVTVTISLRSPGVSDGEPKLGTVLRAIK